MRPSSPLLDSVRDQFEDYDQLAKDFTRVFLNLEPVCLQNAHLFDVVFLVGQSKQKVTRLIGVRAILGVRSRVFQVSKYAYLKQRMNSFVNELDLTVNRKCCMAFNPDLDRRKFLSLNYCLARYLHFFPPNHKHIARRVLIFSKFLILRHPVQKAFRLHPWLKEHSHA